MENKGNQPVCNCTGIHLPFPEEHLHVIAADGCFLDDGRFKTAPGFILKDNMIDLNLNL
jgi:hypothetical protein